MNGHLSLGIFKHLLFIIGGLFGAFKTVILEFCHRPSHVLLCEFIFVWELLLIAKVANVIFGNESVLVSCGALVLTKSGPSKIFHILD